MGETLGKLVALLRSPEGQENALVQRVQLSALVTDVVQHLREMAETRGVDVVVGSHCPTSRPTSRDGELGNSGLGLGLSIVHDCIGALKGDVHVESERGAGTTFLIELPFAPPL